MTPNLDRHLVSLTAPASFAAEQYQGLRLKIERLRQARDVRLVAVSSPGAGDGKTMTAINLSAALARGSKARVLLIDADLRRPSVGRHFQIAADEAGLADVIADEGRPLGSVTRAIDPLTFDIVAAGAAAVPVPELLRSPRLEQLFGEARGRYDYVVLDTPPLVPVYDSALLARSVDGVVVVIAAGKTPRKLLEESLNLLEPAKTLGIVFNGDTRPLYGHYDSSYRRYFPGGQTPRA
jgi:capsular exopolysaccharide synthesis family protein